MSRTNSIRMAKALEELDERSRDIIHSRWLEESKSTLHDLAGKYGVSAERIRQLEQNAMKKVTDNHGSLISRVMK